MRQARLFETTTAEPARRRPIPAKWASVAAATLIVFWLGFAYTYNHFYYFGGTLFDASIFVYLLGWSFPMLEFPPALGGDTYWGTHVRPFFLLVHPLQQLSGLSPVMFLCVMQGATLALLAVVFCLACRRAFEPSALSHHALIALGAVLFAVCSAVTRTIRDAHPEVLIPAGVFLSIYLLIGGRHLAGALALAPFLLVREDSGIYAGFLLLLTAILAVDRSTDRRTFLWCVGLGLAALAYSAVAFGIKPLFPGHHVTRKILGSPPFAHVDVDFILMRLGTFLEHGEAYWLAALIMAGMSVRTRSWIPLVATFALAPTTLLTAMAWRDHVASFALQYGYPLVLMIAWWPIALVLMRRHGAPRPINRRHAAIVLALLIGTGHFSSSLERYLLRNSWLRASPGAAAKLEAAATDIGRDIARREGVYVENAVVALRPDLFPRRFLIATGPRSDARAVFCFEARFAKRCAPTAEVSGLDRQYRLEGTVLLAVAKDHEDWLYDLGFVRAGGDQRGRPVHRSAR